METSLTHVRRSRPSAQEVFSASVRDLSCWMGRGVGHGRAGGGRGRAVASTPPTPGRSLFSLLAHDVYTCRKFLRALTRGFRALPRYIRQLQLRTTTASTRTGGV